MTKLGEMRDLVGIYFRPNFSSPVASRDFVYNFKGFGGDEGGRTPYLNAASVALYQLSYAPEFEQLRFSKQCLPVSLSGRGTKGY